MSRSAFIENIIEVYLKSYQSHMISELLSVVEHTQEKFRPYVKNPIHFILSIYDPLELRYVVLGIKNYSINLNYQHQNIINQKILEFLKENGIQILDKYDKDVVLLSREIEYLFLKLCIDKVENSLNRQIQLYLTQHAIEVSFDLKEMKLIDAEYLWENLEK